MITLEDYRKAVELANRNIEPLPYHLVSRQQLREAIKLNLVSSKEGKHLFIDGKELRTLDEL